MYLGIIFLTFFGDSTMIILGIDPGLAIVGWGVVEYENAKFRVLGYGSINTPAGMSTPERLSRIDLGLKEIIEKYRPTELAVEERNTLKEPAIFNGCYH